MRGTFTAVVVVAAVAVGAGAVFAAGGKSTSHPYYLGSFVKEEDKDAVWSLDAIRKHGKIVRVTDFGWGGLLCSEGGYRIDGDLIRATKVTDGAFQTTQTFARDETGTYKATVKGHFTKNADKVRGIVKLSGSGDCDWQDRFRFP